MSTRRNQADDRWFDHAVAVMPDKRVKMTWTSDEKTFRSLLVPPLPAMDVDGVEMIKTADELLAISVIGRAANALLSKHGQPTQELNPDLIHFLPDTEETGKMLDGGEAVTICGRIYIRRRPDLEWIVFVLTHEVAHLIAFTAMIMRLEPNDAAAAGLRLKELTMRRSGLGFHTKESDGIHRTRFTALNEAVTEMVAFDLRKLIPDDSPLAGLISLNDLRSTASEWPSLELTVALYRSLGVDSLERRQIRCMIINDYLSGSHDFLRLLGRRNRPAAKLLYGLTPDPTDVAAAAEALGFTDLAVRIRSP
jgi:hypothetical protein